MAPFERLCPCGCGKLLAPYNGQRPVVCYRTWQLADPTDRAVIMFPGSSTVQKRAAVRRVLTLARGIAAKRN